MSVRLECKTICVCICLSFAWSQLASASLSIFPRISSSSGLIEQRKAAEMWTYVHKMLMNWSMWFASVARSWTKILFLCAKTSAVPSTARNRPCPVSILDKALRISNPQECKRHELKKTAAFPSQDVSNWHCHWVALPTSGYNVATMSLPSSFSVQSHGQSFALRQHRWSPCACMFGGVPEKEHELTSERNNHDFCRCFFKMLCLCKQSCCHWAPHGTFEGTCHSLQRRKAENVLILQICSLNCFVVLDSLRFVCWSCLSSTVCSFPHGLRIVISSDAPSTLNGFRMDSMACLQCRVRCLEINGFLVHLDSRKRVWLHSCHGLKQSHCTKFSSSKLTQTL